MQKRPIDLISATELARRTNTDVRRVKRLIARGVIKPEFRVGWSNFFRADQVNAIESKIAAHLAGA
jgi:hypothetical protein